MPYTQPITTDDLPTLSPTQVPDHARTEIAHALQLGQKVEWVFSSFTDPGPDWQKIQVNGHTVSGTYHSGY